MAGWIALDIDGTITSDEDSISNEVVDYFSFLSLSGWNICFLTGRLLKFTLPLLKDFNFPYFVAPQNGASLIEMPSQKLLFKNYMDSNFLPHFEESYKDREGGFVVCSGLNLQENIYFNFKDTSSYYFSCTKRVLSDDLLPISEFDKSDFPIVKCVGSFKDLKSIAAKLKLKADSSLIKYPFIKGMYILLVTKIGVNKGHAITTLMKLKGKNGPLISGGNDMNDLSLLKVADFKIAMEDSPKKLLTKAHLIAKSAKQNGIISALKEAIQHHCISNGTQKSVLG